MRLKNHAIEGEDRVVQVKTLRNSKKFGLFGNLLELERVVLQHESNQSIFFSSIFCMVDSVMKGEIVFQLKINQSQVTLVH